MSTLEIILEDLRSLPTPKLEEAADYIHRLRQASVADRVAILRETSGAIRPEEADAIEKAINEDCGEVDARDW